MFPHEITVFGSLVNGRYHRTPITDVFWYGSQGIALSGKGIVDSDSINIIIPKDSLPKDFNVKKGNRIVKGIAKEIEKSINELNKYDEVITVTSVSNYICESNLDCILVSGK